MSATRELDTLEATGLIRLAVAQPELEYLFRHVLVQEATYASLVRADRHRLHVAVADALEDLYADRRREVAGLIAFHLEQAGESARAIPYLIEAGRHAAERQAVREGFDLFDRAYRAATAVESPSAEMRRDRAVAAVERVKVGWTFTPPGPSLALLEEVIPLAEETGDAALIGDAHYWSVFTRQRTGERPDTSAPFARSIARLEELGSSGSVSGVRGRALLSMGLTMSGHLRQGVQMAEQAVRELEASRDPVTASAISQILAFGYNRLGDFAAADRAVAEAARLAEQGDAIAKLDIGLARAFIAFERGDLEGAERYGQICAVGSEELGATSCAIGAHVVVGGIRMMRGDVAEARSRLDRSRQLIQSGAVFPAVRLLAEAIFAGIELMAGIPADASKERWDAALEEAKALRDPYTEASIRRLRAMSLLGAPNPDADLILGDLATSAAMFEQMEARTSLAQTLMAWGQALHAFGRPSEATEKLQRGQTLAAEIGLPMPTAA